MNSRRAITLIWAVAILTSALGIIAWGQGIRWHIIGISNYLLFPVFGLVAFSLMWTHYMAIVAKIIFKIKLSDMANYFKLTNFAVLGALLLHPGLLVWQLWRDGLGYPPFSYEYRYVAPGLGWVTLLGTACWFAFLAYELRRKYAERPWWKHVVNISELAMAGIYYHALRLGAQIQHGWYKSVWYFYGLTLAAALGYIHYRRWYVRHNKQLN
jgi:hypothetical protein